MLFAESIADVNHGHGYVHGSFKVDSDDHFNSPYANDDEYLSHFNAHVPHLTDQSTDGYTDYDESIPTKVVTKGDYGFTPAKSHSDFGYGKKDEKRCPVSGKLLDSLYDGEHSKKDEKRCPVTGKILDNLYGDDAHHDDSYNFGYEHSPIHKPSRGSHKRPRAVKKQIEHHNIGKKTKAGQKDHVKQPHSHTHDWRTYHPDRYGYESPTKHC